MARQARDTTCSDASNGTEGGDLLGKAGFLVLGAIRLGVCGGGGCLVCVQVPERNNVRWAMVSPSIVCSLACLL